VDNALAFGRDAFVVGLGLHVDRAQGVLVQQPLFLMAFCGLVVLAKRDLWIAALVALIYAGLVVPNALHPNIYGGASYIGRFQWAGAAVLMMPTIAALGEIHRMCRPAFAAIAAAGGALQVWFLLLVLHFRLPLLNPGPVPLAAYPSWWGQLGRAVPALATPSWALHRQSTVVGIAAAIAVIAVITVGVALHARAVVTVPMAAATLLLASGAWATAGERGAWNSAVAGAASVAATTGSLIDSDRTAAPPKDPPGWLGISTATLFDEGTYEATFLLKSTAPAGTQLGMADVVDVTPGLMTGVLCTIPIEGKGASNTLIRLRFHLRSSLGGTTIQARAYYAGTGNLSLVTIGLASNIPQTTESCGSSVAA
jgi:hypothetical protein